MLIWSELLSMFIHLYVLLEGEHPISELKVMVIDSKYLLKYLSVHREWLLHWTETLLAGLDCIQPLELNDPREIFFPNRDDKLAQISIQFLWR